MPDTDQTYGAREVKTISSIKAVKLTPVRSTVDLWHGQY